ncbi:hypothetical protein MOP88_01735 [Sphingomonas sp. WKB10]|nr:hypothetical protein [Sphingomonas sp. WKB10]
MVIVIRRQGPLEVISTIGRGGGRGVLIVRGAMRGPMWVISQVFGVGQGVPMMTPTWSCQCRPGSTGGAAGDQLGTAVR